MIELEVLSGNSVDLNIISDSMIPLEVEMGSGGGGGEINNQNKSVTPTESIQEVTADAGYTGLGTVTVGAIASGYVGSAVARRDSDDLTASGATVSVPSGYYENNASKAVASGTEGTPSATKGAVSNHSVSVTPSVTNTAGYINGGTKTGTAVTVSASELVSGAKSITANGNDIDVTNYATANVAVPNSYSASDEGKVVSSGALVAQTSDTVTVNDTYDTTLINSLTVNVSGGGGTDYFFELNDFNPNQGKWGMNLDLRSSHYPYIDFANGDYLEVEWLDTGISTSPNIPNIFGIGTNIYSWGGTTNIIFYLNYSNGKTAPTLRVHQNGVDTESATYDPSVPHTFKIDKDYVYLDGTAIVAPNPSVVSNTYPEIGAVEGNARYYGIFNHIRVVKGA